MTSTKPRITVTVNEEYCKGCSLCVLTCPKKALELAPHMGLRGFHPAFLARPEDCTGCTQCALMCPDACLTIVKE